jgi:hypothetical protein
MSIGFKVREQSSLVWCFAFQAYVGSTVNSMAPAAAPPWVSGWQVWDLQAVWCSLAKPRRRQPCPEACVLWAWIAFKGHSSFLLNNNTFPDQIDLLSLLWNCASLAAFLHFVPSLSSFTGRVSYCLIPSLFLIPAEMVAGFMDNLFFGVIIQSHPWFSLQNMHYNFFIIWIG